VTYFNARRSLLRDRKDEYRSGLEEVVRMTDTGDWLKVLANHLLEQSYKQSPEPDDEPVR
jgi:hypothetical protein